MWLVMYSDGGYQLTQTTPGQIAVFNMWDYEMTAEEVNSKTCGSGGNVSSWDTLNVKGISDTAYRIFPGCKGKCY